ncbi:OmpA family protein [Aquirufa regiilacus]|uniref:OmpA family protein n=1 Tax=Aquirufa regiilacus TaxID=3024868 RepID=A0ABU3TQK9_9BACT|nr:OmpA family protein [Aquirufa sp. LEOWEIH-7C]MDU0808156.1 OmpA family protein [Aquirufa sp. LEOWEIH-7C]
MRQFALVIVLLCSLFNLPAQSVQWASKVLTFSSEYTDPLLGKEYRALHILGRPSKYPKFAASPSAWQSLTPDNPGGEFIIVSFDTAKVIKQVAIFENFGAGSITRVDALDENNRLFLLKEFPNGYALANGQLTRVRLASPTPFKVKSIKITLNSMRVQGYSQIDAIAISDVDTPIEDRIKLEVDPNAYLVKENLGTAINSKFNEICPVVSPDGKKLYFTRWKHPDNLGANKNQDIWVANLNDKQQWDKASLFPSPINNDENNAVCGISPNGKTMLLNNVYGKDGQMEKGVSLSFLLRTGEWSFPKPIRIQNFKNKSEYSEYTLAPNGKVLLMTTETKDSYGGKDIYVSFLKADDTWTEPKNIGSSVNTGESESTPFIAPDGQTMYFSSSGHVGYGNNDIFLTRRLDDSWLNWSVPENVGPVVNTNQWDGYFTVSAKGDFAYFSSVENSMGAEDIYRIKIPDKVKPQTLVQVSGQVINQLSKLPVASKILVRSRASADTMQIDYDPYLGDFSFMWPSKKPFYLEIKSKGFLMKRVNLDFRDQISFSESKQIIGLTPLELNKQFKVPNLNFAQSKSEISKESFASLDEIVSILQDNEGLNVLIEGHTDNQGDWDENLKLSNERVEQVKGYLIKQGIESSRIQAKGWGGTKLLSTSTAEEKRRLNRRVEFSFYVK